MSTRFDWDLDHSSAPDPEISPPRPPPAPPRRLRLTPFMIALYVGAVAVAGWFGFNLGRWSVDTAEQVRSIENQIEVEQLAWRQGDISLFSTTLHPEAPEPWRNRKLSEFRSYAPLEYSIELLERGDEADGAIDVFVQVTSPEGTQKEMRRYRAIGGAWMRIPGAAGLD